MSTKTTASTNNVYSPEGMNAYQAFMPVLQRSLLSMTQNPLATSFFNQQYGAALNTARQSSLLNNKNTFQNLLTGGGLLSGSGGYVNALLNRNMRTRSLLDSSAFNSALSGALANRDYGLRSMQAFQPLMTGQDSSFQKSGLGTWLPQVAGTALSMAMPGIGSMLAGNGFLTGFKKDN